jgi:L-ascorbate metabolism protein UlaG (beta-lactamase superfamily)
MEITYLGHSSFKLKGRSASLVTDPYNEKCGKFPRDVEVDIVTVSHDHDDHNQVQKVGGSPFVINGPGEFEVKEISVIGISTFHDGSNGSERGRNVVYVIEVDGLRIVHLGDLGHKLTPDQLEEMGPIDILMVPVGGMYTIDAKVAVEVVKQIDPWIVIPMHFKQEGLDSQLFGGLTGTEEFVKEMGVANVQVLPKLSISPEKLPSEMQVVVLERK